MREKRHIRAVGASEYVTKKGSAAGRFLPATMSTEMRHGKFNRLSEMPSQPRLVSTYPGILRAVPLTDWLDGWMYTHHSQYLFLCYDSKF